jgi:uncharacterized protein (TIGR03435 family)
LATAAVTLLAVPVIAGLIAAPRLLAQVPTAQSPATQPAAATVPQWQIDAGGKMAFEVASIKANKSGGDRPTSNFPLGQGNAYTPNGGLFTAENYPLFAYIAFAYKMNTFQGATLAKLAPKWALSERFDIQARAGGNPTKDQMRLMMQALLADRLKLAMHLETRQLPILALELVNPGKTGPQFQPYPDGSPCEASTPTATGTPRALVAGGFPEICGGVYEIQASAPGRVKMGARNVSTQVIADQLPTLANDPDRPVFDRTGLTGAFDFAIEFTPQLNGPLPPGSTFQPDAAGPTFIEAMKEQLGLKLVPQTGPVDVLVIDHIEEPSPN